jgi:hypothetical protein
VSPVASGDAVAWAMTQAQWIAVWQFLTRLAWALVAGLAGAGACFGFGWAAWETLTRVGPAAGRTPDGSPEATDDDDAVAPEALRGIREIEEYLAAAGAGRSQSPRFDGGDRETGAGTTPA